MRIPCRDTANKTLDMRHKRISYHYDARSEELPDKSPVPARRHIVTKHEFDIVEEAVDAVVPSDDANFSHADDECRKGGSVVVDQLQYVHSTVGAHDESEQEHDEGRSKQDPP